METMHTRFQCENLKRWNLLGGPRQRWQGIYGCVLNSSDPTTTTTTTTTKEERERERERECVCVCVQL